MNLLKIGFPAVVLLFSNGFANIALYNVILQLLVFIITANVPALITGRMSYVDLGWPYGLVTIGILPFIASNGNISKIILSLMHFFLHFVSYHWLLHV